MIDPELKSSQPATETNEGQYIHFSNISSTTTNNDKLPLKDIDFLKKSKPNPLLMSCSATTLDNLPSSISTSARSPTFKTRQRAYSSPINFEEPIKLSYSLQDLKRMLILSRDLTQRMQSLHPTPPLNILPKLDRIGVLQASKVELKEQLGRIMKEVELSTVTRDSLIEANQIRRQALARNRASLTELKLLLEKETVSVQQSKILWLDNCRLLTLCQARLAEDLDMIFSITQDSENIYSIRGVPLSLPPVSDHAWGLPCSLCTQTANSVTSNDQRHTSIALGFAAQLIGLLAQYLQFSLPFPLEVAGSRSHILDPVASPDQLLRYPLYYPGDVSTAISLLNQNVILLLESLTSNQIRSDLPLLGNLNLLIRRLIAKPWDDS